MITLDDLQDFGTSWFNAVATGASAAERAQVLLPPSCADLRDLERRDYQPRGSRETARPVDRRATPLGHFDLTPLNASPERVRARGTVYWQAEFPDRPAPNVIKAVVGEDWLLERATSGELKFVLYINTFHHMLPSLRRSICDQIRSRSELAG